MAVHAFRNVPMSRLALRQRRVPDFWVGIVVGLALVGLVSALV